jgi:hypothetical protein
MGGTTVEELQARMSHAEFVEWAAFCSIEPLPGLRSDTHTAMVMLLLAHIHRSKGGKKAKLEDFLPDFWNDKGRPEALARKLRALSAQPGEKPAAAPRMPSRATRRE